MWRVLRAVIQRTDRSLLLSSHHLEEFEALCTRLAIMVDGRLECLGSPQHIKARFGGGGCTIVVGASSTDSATSQVVPFLRTHFQHGSLVDVRLGQVTFAVPAADWSHVFAVMEEAAATLDLLDYNVSQTSLEDIFLRLTRTHIRHVTVDRNLDTTGLVHLLAESGDEDGEDVTF